MKNNQFIIKILNLYWINGEEEDPDDLCLHGDVYVKIGDEVIADKYSCTASSTALYLLKSLEEDHKIGENTNQLLPCCVHFIIPNEKEDKVEILECPNGIDWSVIQSDNYIKLITKNGKEVSIELDIYKKIVFDFVDEIEDFYKNSNEKNIPEDEFDYNRYKKFWLEWHNIRNN